MVETPVNGGRRRWLAPGESGLAWGGLALVGVLLLAVTLSAWWSLRAWNQSALHDAGLEADRVAGLLATAAEASLSGDSPTALRRLATDAAMGGWRVEVSLDGVGLIASGTPGELGSVDIPASWTDLGDLGVLGGADPMRPVRKRAFRVPGRGTGVVAVTPPAVSATAGEPAIAIRAGSLAAAAIGLVALLFVYRTLRSRLRGMASIGDALVLLAHGEQRTDVLVVDEGFGEAGAAWNALLADRRVLRAQAAAERVDQALAGGGHDSRDLREAFDALRDGVMLVDDAGTILETNGAAGVLLRKERGVIVGSTVLESLGEQAADLLAGIGAGEGHARAAVDLENEPGSEKGVLRVGIVPLRNGARARALVRIEDVTQLRHAEEGRNHFLAQATHELRTPLTNIRLYVEQAIEEGDEDPQLREQAFNVIGQESRRLERIVGDMLSVAELEAGTLAIRRGDVRLESLLEQLENDYRAQAENKEILLRFDLPPRLPVISGDQDRLGLVLHNLMGNALKYTPAGGEVVVLASADDEGTVRIAVRDTGIGIAPDQFERVFERFARAEDDRVRHVTGTGLGLALAREVARAHGGEIEIESEIDKGSTFTLVLPGAAERSMAA